MGFERDEKLMIDILAEVAAKSDINKTPIVLDLSDPKRAFNHELLTHEKGGVFKYHSEPISFSQVQAGQRKPERCLIGLSTVGQNFLSDLRKTNERDDREKETLKIAKWSFWLAVVAIILALFALFIPPSPVLNFFISFIKHLT
jgi:hypothetical protein